MQTLCLGKDEKGPYGQRLAGRKEGWARGWTLPRPAKLGRRLLPHELLEGDYRVKRGRAAHVDIVAVGANVDVRTAVCPGQFRCLEREISSRPERAVGGNHGIRGRLDPIPTILGYPHLRPLPPRSAFGLISARYGRSHGTRIGFVHRGLSRACRQRQGREQGAYSASGFSLRINASISRSHSR